MKAEELSVGNFILYAGGVWPITIVSKHGIQSKTSQGIINAKFTNIHLNPIPITKEWLTKFGFQQQGSYFNLELEINLDLFYCIDKDFEYCGIGYKNQHVDLHRLPHIKHVHQLQNFYFTYKNEELTIKKIRWENL